MRTCVLGGQAKGPGGGPLSLSGQLFFAFYRENISSGTRAFESDLTPISQSGHQWQSPGESAAFAVSLVECALELQLIIFH